VRRWGAWVGGDVGWEGGGRLGGRGGRWWHGGWGVRIVRGNRGGEGGSGCEKFVGLLGFGWSVGGGGCGW